MQELLAIAQEKSKGSSDLLFKEFSSLFEQNSKRLNDRERDLFLDILSRLIKDVEIAIRRELAGNLADSDTAPRELILLLANDDIQVALPILMSNGTLLSRDLVDIIHHRSMRHQLAIARRKNIDETVSSALVDTDNEDIIIALLSNKDARISADVLAFLAAKSEHVEGYQEPLILRPDLPPALAEKMYVWVSDALREYVKSNFEIDTTELDRAIDASISTVEKQKAEETRDEIASRLIEKLHEGGELSPGFLLKSLNQGEIVLFETAFAKLLDLDVIVLRHILYDDTGVPLAFACKGVGIDQSVFHTIYQEIREAADKDSTISQADDQRVRRIFSSTTKDKAPALLRGWLTKNPPPTEFD